MPRNVPRRRAGVYVAIVSARFPHLDPAACSACRKCEVACVETHYGLSGLEPDDAVVLERRRLKIVVSEVPALNVCNHCAASPCVTVCPHFALIRFRDGRVDLLEDRCTGCGKCIAACPFDAIRRVTDLDIAVKCDGCRDIAGGPACAPACPTGALTIVSG